MAAKARRKTAPEADARTIREISMTRCSFWRLRQRSQVGVMLLVAAAHFGGEAGDIVTPSGKDFPHDGFHTLTHNS